MSETFTVATLSDLQPGAILAVDVGDERIALFNIDGTIYAINDSCTHFGASLSEGSLDGFEITCPYHSARFDVRTGETLSPMAPDDLDCYEVVIDGTDVKLRVR